MQWAKAYNVALFWLRQVAWLPAFCHAAIAYIFFALVVLHQRAAFSPPQLLRRFPWTVACVLVSEPGRGKLGRILPRPCQHAFLACVRGDGRLSRTPFRHPAQAAFFLAAGVEAYVFYRTSSNVMQVSSRLSTDRHRMAGP